NNRLLVTATDDQLREIEEVVRVVDVAPAQAARELSVIPLEAKPAAEIIPLVNQLVAQLGEPGQPSPTLMADPTGKQLIVLAAARDQERIRTLVKQFDVTPATSAPRQFRGIELYSRSAAEFTPLVAQLYQEQLRGQPEPPGGPATVLPETKGNRIMVSGGEREIARVEAVIRQLDPAEKKSAREETRVIRLQTASAPDLAGLVEKSLNAQSQQVRVLLDARSNSLVITGERSAVEAAGQMIQQLDTRPEAGPRELRLLELKSADAATLSPMVNNLFTEVLRDQRGASYVSTTRIVPDTIANRLIVTGSREEIEQVASLVNRLDRSPEQAPGARVFKLNQAEAALIAPIVSNAMLRFDARGQALRRVTVSADDKSNSLIVSGTRTDLQDAESVIERLDGGSVNAERLLRIFDVKSDPDALAALVQRVFAAQNPGRNTAGLFTLTPEPAGRRLLVHAPPAVLAQIETVVSTLDARPDQGIRELHAVELANVTAAEILPRVTQIYSEQAQGKTLKPATILADAGGARLLVQGTTEQAAAVRQIVDTLASAPRPARESRIFDLGRLSEAQRLLPLVQQLYRDQVGGSPSLGTPDAQIVSDGRTGRLLVSARADQLPAIEAIVNRLKADAGTPAARETRTLEVGTAADVQRLQPLVQQLYQDQWKDRQDTDPADAQIVPDPRTGRLIVTGKPAHLDQIEALLKQLGAGQARAGNRQTRIIDLSTASAVELAGTVRTLYTEQARGRLGTQAPDTLITPDAGGNRLILVGEAEELSAVEEIVRQLDKVSAQSASARVFKIKSADPDKVAEILTTSLVRYDAYGRPQKRATVSVDAKTRTLIVTGDPKELQGVSVIIEQLDQSLGAQPERKTQVVTLKQGRAAALAGRVRQLYADRIKSQPELGTSDVLILEEPEGNQLILAGNEAQLALVNQLVTELQAAQVARSARETRMFEVGHAEELTRLQPLIKQLYQDRLKGRDNADPADAQIIADARQARFIVTGRTNHLAEIESILAQLRGTNPATEPRDTRVIDLTSANAVELAATVRTLYQEQARNRPGVAAADTLIVPDTNGNRLIVTAGTNELAVVEEIVRKLDKVGAQSASTRVFKVKSADPDKVAEILGTALVRYDAYGRAQKRVSVVTDP
ncbi:MAG: secretin N-terminal domain-containing protein, partial [Verrucomicrobiota bacterium]